MTDKDYDGLIERLRSGNWDGDDCEKAADALAAMQVRLGVAEYAIDHFDRQQTANEARIAALEKALTEIAEFQATEPWRITAKWMADRASAALAKGEAK